MKRLHYKAQRNTARERIIEREVAKLTPTRFKSKKGGRRAEHRSR